MPDTIESFVARLQTEGVQSGREEARKIIEQARREAEQIIGQADQQAERIVADARKQAETELARGRTELKLAARDALLHLRSALNRALEAVLRKAAAPVLRDDQFLRQLLHDLVLRYAQADIERTAHMDIRVSPEMYAKLSDWAISEIRGRSDSHDLGLDLRGELQAAGFEYNISGGTVEVTTDSVVEVLARMIGPRLGDLLDASRNGHDSEAVTAELAAGSRSAS